VSQCIARYTKLSSCSTIDVKRLLESLIFSLPEFGNVAIFMIFVFILFATMGLQQYNGGIYNVCRKTPEPVLNKDGEWEWEPELSFQRVCSTSGVGTFQCPDGYYCGNVEMYPELNLVDDKINDRVYINFGVTNYDNLGTSLLTVFEMIMSETWYTQIINTMDLDVPLIGFVYCLGIIIVGQFFLLNLILAIMIEAFKKSHEKQLQEALQQLEANESEEFTSMDLSEEVSEDEYY
jgi:Ion transport protein